MANNLKKDSRIQGRAAEVILESLLSHKEGVHAVQFDTVGFDLIVWDNLGNYFPVGRPAYIQLKLRMNKDGFTTQGHNPSVIEGIKETANYLGVSEEDCYFCVAFAENNDVRTTKFFIIPLDKLGCFKKGSQNQYRFNIEKLLKEDTEVGKLVVNKSIIEI